MELKVFRDLLYAGGGCCTVKAEIPVETEILISDYLPQVFRVVKCFARPVVLQKQLQPGRLTLEGYIRCTVYYQGEGGAGLCQTEQKLPFQKTLELPAFSFTSWSAAVEGETEYINCRAVTPPADRSAGGLWAGGVGQHPVQHRGCHRPERLRHPAAAGHAAGGEAGRRSG